MRQREGRAATPSAAIIVGGTHTLDNLQMLCRPCNLLKGTRTIDFRRQATPLPGAAAVMAKADWTFTAQAEPLEFQLRRMISFSFECQAVAVMWTQLGPKKGRIWTVKLHPGNEPQWIRPLIAQAYAAWSRADPEFAKYVAREITVLSHLDV